MAAGLYDITNEVLGKGHFAVVKLARHCLTCKCLNLLFMNCLVIEPMRREFKGPMNEVKRYILVHH